MLKGGLLLIGFGDQVVPAPKEMVFPTSKG
jgi:hypothetical protein